jgi:hypothetical protein
VLKQHGSTHEASEYARRASLGLAAAMVLAVLAPVTMRAAAATASCTDGAGKADATGVAIDTVRAVVCYDGAWLHAGTDVQGQFLGIRAALGIMDDLTTDNDERWAYPDTGTWDPQRNVEEFIARFDDYKAKGLDGFTLGLQGGHPRFNADDANDIGDRDFSTFDAKGNIRDAFRDRLERVLQAAAANDLIVIVQLFYQNATPFGDADASPRAPETAIDAIVPWLRDHHPNNVMIEVANEVSDSNYLKQGETQLRPDNIAARVEQIRSLWPQALITVNCQFGADICGTDDSLQRQIDFVSIHGNSMTASETVQRIRAARDDSDLDGAPVIVTEDSWYETQSDSGKSGGGASFAAVIHEGAGWFLYDQEEYVHYDCGLACAANRYRLGFQSPPVNWSPGSSPTKISFFDAVRAVTSGSTPTTSPTSAPTASPTPSVPPARSDVAQAAFEEGPSMSSVTVTLPSKPTPGNTLVAIVTSNGISGLTHKAPSGFHRDIVETGENIVMLAFTYWSKLADADDPRSYTFGIGGDTARLAISLVELEGSVTVGGYSWSETTPTTSVQATPTASPETAVGETSLSMVRLAGNGSTGMAYAACNGEALTALPLNWDGSLHAIYGTDTNADGTLSPCAVWDTARASIISWVTYTR